MLQPLEPVTICDQFIPLFLGQLKHEVGGKTIKVSLHALIENLGLYLIQFSKVTVNHHFLTPNEKDALLNDFRRNYVCHDGLVRNMLVG